MKIFSRLKKILKNPYKVYLESGNIPREEGWEWEGFSKWYDLKFFLPYTKLFCLKRIMSRRLAKAIVTFIKGLDNKVFRDRTPNIEGALGKDSYTFIWTIGGYPGQFVLRLKVTEKGYSGVYGIWGDDGVYFDQNNLPMEQLNKLLIDTKGKYEKSNHVHG